MANLKSSEKDIRRTGRRTAANQARLTRIKTAVRAVKDADNRDAAVTALRAVSALLDRAGKNGLLHRNTADRQKSRLSRSVNSRFPKK